MSKLQLAQPFDQEQLGILEASLDLSLVSWAIDNPLVREPGKGNRLIRDLATLHAFGKVLLARGRLVDFESATKRGHDMNAVCPELKYRSPKERAGTAAGQLAIAKLLTRWYGLAPEDFARLPEPQKALEFVDWEVEGLEEAVCRTPQTLGLSAFTARDVYFETRLEAEAAVGTHGPAALEPYMVFTELAVK